MGTWITKLLGLTSDEIEEIDSWIYDSCIDENEFGEFVQDQSKELEKCLWELDLYSLLLEFIAMKGDVSELIPFLYNHGAEITFRITPKEAGKIMAQVSEEDRNEAWFFILDKITVELPDEQIE
jgi:hypothetical protein